MFLAEMNLVVTWKPLIDVIKSVYPEVSSKGGCPLYLLATMSPIHLMQ